MGVAQACHLFVITVLFLRRGNTKNDNSLKRLRIALKSEKTIEKTTRH